ncbi:MAG: hypothetical protein K2Q06_07660 [Parvularculaceae bacterium]|nr:hypothetical protein [Parvularculaceae bacterium]
MTVLNMNAVLDRAIARMEDLYEPIGLSIDAHDAREKTRTVATINQAIGLKLKIALAAPKLAKVEAALDGETPAQPAPAIRTAA